MSLLALVLICAACLLVAYRAYGSLLAKLLKLDDRSITPAVELRDDLDYQPIEPKFLLSQHFSAIAAAGPIVGPILAGVMFGWLPALLWILIGSIFIGGVHDMASLVASIRHKARSIAEVVHDHMSRRSYVLFLVFVYIALIYIIVAFTDIVAAAFVGSQTLDDGSAVSGGGIATSSLLYLVLPVIMGLLLRYTRLSLLGATLIFLPLVALAIWAGQKIPLNLDSLLNISSLSATRAWGVLLLGYCFVASLAPMWMLLQPRGHLGGYFLYAALAFAAVGIVVTAITRTTSIEYPAFTGWVFIDPRTNASSPLFPILFITIACGACSGFHCLIASGTTSKQLRRESDSKIIGYGAMLLEGMVAVISLVCVMMLTQSQGQSLLGKPNFIYAQGLGRFMNAVGIPLSFGIVFGLLAFTTFVYDTLDVCTRLGRYIVQELTGLSGAAGRLIGTAITAGIPVLFIIKPQLDAQGQPQPAWKTFWSLFGASNQLLAALALIGITVWLWRTYRARWIWFVLGAPTVLMYVMSTWALFRFVGEGFFRGDSTMGYDLIMPANPVPWVALILVGLAILLLVEAVMVFVNPPPPPEQQGVMATA
jgi:carbon starvation protein